MKFNSWEFIDADAVMDHSSANATVVKSEHNVDDAFSSATTGTQSV